MSRKRNQLPFSQNCCLILQIRGNFLEKLTQTTKIVSQNILCPGRDSYREPFAHTRITLRYSICSTIRFFPSQKFLLNYNVVPVHVKKAYGEVKVEHGTFLNSVLNLGKKSASSSDRFNSSEIASCTHCTGR
jgi:hypothetical protein